MLAGITDEVEEEEWIFGYVVDAFLELNYMEVIAILYVFTKVVGAGSSVGRATA